MIFINLTFPIGAVLVLALGASAFFSASEAAYLALDRFTLNRLGRPKLGISSGLAWCTLFLYKRFSSFIVTLLLMNMFANVVATVSATMLVEQFLLQLLTPFFGAEATLIIDRYVVVSELVFLLGFSLVLIIFCEFFPKRFAVKHALNFTQAVVLLLFPLYCLLMPMTVPLAWGMRALVLRMRLPFSAASPAEHAEHKPAAVNGLPKQLPAAELPAAARKNGQIGGQPLTTPKPASTASMLDDEKFFKIPFDPEQFLSYAQQSSKLGVLKEVEVSLLQNFVKYKSMEVRSFMIPRELMLGLDLANRNTVEWFKREIRKFPYKNIPFYRKQKDNIVGVLSQEKCALRSHLLDFKTVAELEKYLEKPIVIPETKNILAALADILNSASEVALLSDEYGGIEGIVTFDDIIFRFFGKFAGDPKEHGTAELIKGVGRGVFRVQSHISLSDLNDYFATRLHCDTAETLGGYLLEQFKHIPERYATFKDAFFEYTVQERTPKGLNVIIVKRVVPQQRAQT